MHAIVSTREALNIGAARFEQAFGDGDDHGILVVPISPWISRKRRQPCGYADVGPAFGVQSDTE